MPSPDDCRYSDSHEWFRVDGDVVTLGITPHAAAELTDVTYVEMRPVGTAVNAGDAVAEVESVKISSWANGQVASIDHFTLDHLNILIQDE